MINSPRLLRHVAQPMWKPRRLCTRWIFVVVFFVVQIRKFDSEMCWEFASCKVPIWFLKPGRNPAKLLILSVCFFCIHINTYVCDINVFSKARKNALYVFFNRLHKKWRLNAQKIRLCVVMRQWRKQPEPIKRRPLTDCFHWAVIKNSCDIPLKNWFVHREPKILAATIIHVYIYITGYCNPPI